MRVVVLGAGVVGVVTAYYLARRGHDVTVLEQADRVASGTSFANAGQLSYSFTDALARPAFLRSLPSLLLNRDPGVLFRPRVSFEFLRWSGAFLRQCTAARARENTLAVLELAMRSSKLMDELIGNVPLEFAYRPAGKLVLLSNAKETRAAQKALALKRGLGCRTEILTVQEALRIEPALADFRADFAAAIWSADDRVADAWAFTAGLARWLNDETTVDIRFGEHVSSIVTENGEVTAVRGSGGEHRADAVIVSLGCDSGRLLRPLRIPVPIYPVRGYSVTLPATPGTPRASVTHVGHRMVFSRLGQQARIAGFADFVDSDDRHDDARIAALVRTAQRIAPDAARYDAAEARPWGGLRPMTPDSRPLVGPTRIPGLYLNTGHGMLGWTLACASGHAIAEAVGAADRKGRAKPD